MTTGEVIRSIRKQKKLSQYELSKRTKILNQSQISKIEKGDRKITDLDLKVISNALGVNIEDLLL